MNCPYCGAELTLDDYYGKTQHAEHYWIYPHSWIEKEGDIFKCNNEDCGAYQETFYTDKQGDLHEGYPC
jgi:hypothetical protein